MLKHSFFGIVCITIFFVIVLFVNKFYVPYNNKLEKEMLITREYTNSQIIEMIDRINMHIYKSKRFENEYKKRTCIARPGTWGYGQCTPNECI